MSLTTFIEMSLIVIVKLTSGWVIMCSSEVQDVFFFFFVTIQRLKHHMWWSFDLTFHLIFLVSWKQQTNHKFMYLEFSTMGLHKNVIVHIKSVWFFCCLRLLADEVNFEGFCLFVCLFICLNLPNHCRFSIHGVF